LRQQRSYGRRADLSGKCPAALKTAGVGIEAETSMQEERPSPVASPTASAR